MDGDREVERMEANEGRAWVLVPVNPLGEGKSRLQPALSPGQRGALSAQLLAHVLEVVKGVEELGGVVVVSRDEQVLALGESAGAVAMLEEGDELNRALAQAAGWAVEHGAGAILVLPADLPLITGEDVRRILTLGQSRLRSLVISPSRDGGTNALWIRPPGAIDFAFGPQSFDRHREQARAAGLPVEIVSSPTLALDVDEPEDLARWAELYPNASLPHACR
jgi:2-phospho-L-lactate/phosphoenolpyruvate guanylyltransferase